MSSDQPHREPDRPAEATPRRDRAAESAAADAAAELAQDLENLENLENPDTAPPDQPAAASAPPSTDEPVWPPPESSPPETNQPPAQPGTPAIMTKTEDPPRKEGAPAAEGAGAAKPGAAKPGAAKPAGRPALEEPASRPNIEMSLSESTLLWLVDADEPMPVRPSDPAIDASYDAGATAAGVRRAIAFIGGVGLVALIFAFVLHIQAERHQAALAAQPKPIDSTAVLTQRAQAALVGGRPAEALDFARLAVGQDARAGDAYYIIAIVQRSNGHPSDARDAFRHYLEVAPLGVHADAARRAIAELPP